MLRRCPTGSTSDYADYPLRTAQVEVWHGLIFVNLNPGRVEPIALQFSAFDAMIDKFAPERTKLVHEKKYQLDANWKVAVENALECYHCPGSHRTLCSVVDVPGLIADLKDWFADDGGDSPADLGQSGMRIQTGMQTLSIDGKLLTSKLLGACTESETSRPG